MLASKPESSVIQWTEMKSSALEVMGTKQTEHPIYYGANQISCQELSMQKFELLLLELFEREKRANRQNGQTS